MLNSVSKLVGFFFFSCWWKELQRWRSGVVCVTEMYWLNDSINLYTTTRSCVPLKLSTGWRILVKLHALKKCSGFWYLWTQYLAKTKASRLHFVWKDDCLDKSSETWIPLKTIVWNLGDCCTTWLVQADELLARGFWQQYNPVVPFQHLRYILSNIKGDS